MQTFLKGKRVGYWLSEKKIRKLNFQAFAELCRKRGVEVVQLDLTKPIEDQGPLDVIIHKLTDVILEADQNDSQSLELVHRFQEYIDAHPETIILDPLPAIRTLLDRSKSYELIRQIEAYMQGCRERSCGLAAPVHVDVAQQEQVFLPWWRNLWNEFVTCFTRVRQLSDTFLNQQTPLALRR